MDTESPRTTVLTLRLDEASMAFFEDLRQRHFPPALNRVPAHLTLFHTLPLRSDVADALCSTAKRTPTFTLEVTGLQFLGRGVAYALASAEAAHLHRELAAAFQPHLTAQDRQGFRPHVVVQNKASADEAKRLLKELDTEFTPWHVQAVGLDWWDYLGGSWQLREHFRFG